MSRSLDHQTWEDEASPIMPGSYAVARSMGDVPSWERGEPAFHGDSFGTGLHYAGGGSPQYQSLGDVPSWERGDAAIGPGQGFAAGEPHPSAGPHCGSGGHDVGPHDDGGLGWDFAAWGEAGGFDAVLVGHLAEALGGAAGGGTIIIVPIEHLEINSITQIENTEVFLNAANGGSISVGGSVNALGNQSLADTVDDHAFGAPHTGGAPFDFGHDSTLATNDVTLLAGNGSGNLIGGNVTAIADQTLPEAHLF